MDAAERTRLLVVYRETRCWLAVAGGWQGLDFHPSEGVGAIITAWNPMGARLPPAVNDARDAVLRAELDGYGLAPLRARGLSPDGTWHEDGWLVAHDPKRTILLLRRWHQFAAYLLDPAGRSLLWAEDGAVERL